MRGKKKWSRTRVARTSKFWYGRSRPIQSFTCMYIVLSLSGPHMQLWLGADTPRYQSAACSPAWLILFPEFSESEKRVYHGRVSNVLSHASIYGEAERGRWLAVFGSSTGAAFTRNSKRGVASMSEPTTTVYLKDICTLCFFLQRNLQMFSLGKRVSYQSNSPHPESIGTHIS